MCIDAGPDSRTPLGDCQQPGQRRLDTLTAESNLTGPATDHLVQADGHGVHQMSASGFDDTFELTGFFDQCLVQDVKCGQELPVQFDGSTYVDDSRYDVVTALAHVDVIIWVYRLPQGLAGKSADHFVGVHVAGGAGSRLKDIHRKCCVAVTCSHLVGCLPDSL